MALYNKIFIYAIEHLIYYLLKQNSKKIMDPSKEQYIFTDELSKAIATYIRRMKRLHALTSKDIVQRLQEFDINISPDNLNVRLNSGKMSSNFFVALMSVIGEEKLGVKEIVQIVEENRKKNESNGSLEQTDV